MTWLSLPLLRRFGTGRVVTGGLLVTALGLGALAAAVSGPAWAYVLALVVVGAGAGLCSSPLSTLLTRVHRERTGRSGAGVNSTLRELASAGGVGLAGLALAVAAHGDGAPRPEEIVAAARGVFASVGAVLLVAAGVVAVPRRRGLSPRSTRSSRRR
ncbi:hypothetical protein [Litorihabitans aurantiacus]|uniref:hypothetical protein n=1 Tax=Litorihabitans aurantiacus TaxID=1930061 RepID=UPI0024E14881|nr:hypothetical protein [Litorihabitans aurantiacus]